MPNKESKAVYKKNGAASCGRGRETREFRHQLFIGMSLILGWVPSLLLLGFAVLGFLTGVAAVFFDSGDVSGEGFLLSMAFFVLGTLGIIGYIGLTLVCWELKIWFHFRGWFLLCGIFALLISSIYLILNTDNLSNFYENTLLFSFLFYFFICPLSIGLIHAVQHFKYQYKVS